MRPLILLVVAMRAEADPLIDELGLAPVDETEPGLPTRWWRSPDERITLAVNGVDPDHGVDSIGTDAASLTTHVSIRRWSPALVISAGTCGGFQERGGAIGDVIVGAGTVVHHDRRIPIPGFDALGRGEHPVADRYDDTIAALGLARGPVSTSNSLDAPETDLVAMTAHGTEAKEMEAAAVAAVCRRHRVDFLPVKAVTDLVDHPTPTAEQFDANLAQATARLAEVIGDLVPALLDAD